MKKRVRDIVKDILIAEHVEYVFGHTGDNILDLWQSIKSSSLQPIFNKTEAGAVFMADGYSRASNKIGVVLTTGGPGATNMTTGLATAYFDSTPILAISGSVRVSDLGKNAFQEGSGRGRSIEQRLIFKSVCKQAMLAQSPEAVADMMFDGLRAALSGRPGPVYLEVPSNFWNIEVAYNYQTPTQYKNLSIPNVNKDDAQVIIKQLFNSLRPIVVVGEGALEGKNSAKEMMDVLTKINVPFCASPIGKNLVNEFNELYLGAGYDDKITHDYLRTCDFILQIGSRAPSEYFIEANSRSIKVAQVDSDPNEIGRSFPVNYSCVGSISSFLNSIPAKEHKNSTDLSRMVRRLKLGFVRSAGSTEVSGLNPLCIINIVQKLTPKNSIIVCDTGYTKARVIQEYKTTVNQLIIVSDRNGCMGFSIPAAMGAAIAQRGVVVCFCGDGGFQMSMNELGTAMNYQIKVIFIVENNGGCMSIADFNMKTYSNQCMDVFDNPDFVKIADAYEMKGYSVKNQTQFSKFFKEALKGNKSVLIEVNVRQSKAL